MSFIRIIKARQNNLKNITFSFPKNALVVITGPSGSGKSTIAMDVLYAEGQRRYIESLPSYARQFLGTPEKPDVESIEGLCPAIAIDQKTASSNIRSTVGTVTEIYEYLRVLYATIGTPLCTICAVPIMAVTPAYVAEMVLLNKKSSSFIVAAPLVNNQKGDYVQLLSSYVLRGYKRFFIDQEMTVLRTPQAVLDLALQRTKKHVIDVIIDEIEAIDSSRSELVEAITKAFSYSDGICKIYTDNEVAFYSAHLSCTTCRTSFPLIDARLFSFNSPLGACPTCKGLGNSLLYETEALSGENIFIESGTDYVPLCKECNGSRLNKYARSVNIEGKNIYECASLSIDEAFAFAKEIQKKLDTHFYAVTERLFAELCSRLQFLINVGLTYLTLARPSATLSGGESQRIRLATQIGSGLSGVLYVLDEPSIGLHQSDNDRLIETLKKLRDLNNTVVVVEHDRDTMLAADYLIDVGPGAGVHGGEIVAEGIPQEVIDNKKSLTGSYLAHRISLKRMTKFRIASQFLKLHNAHLHNLKDITVEFPLGVLCGVSGVSGSGKSSLILGELVHECKKAFAQKRIAHIHNLKTKLTGNEKIKDLIVIDQKPIGRTPRSNPVTYLGIFDYIRQLYASLPESKVRGYTPGTFSFNVGEGRCSACAGKGTRTISMHLLPDVTVECHICKGTGYTRAVLEITYREKNISDVLRMTIEEACIFFQHHRSIARKLNMLAHVGLDYITLGQPATTFSGGEAQRIKLADELAKRGEGTLYILDEPTTGLHFHDISNLLKVLEKLVEKGNSIIIIEHNIEVLAYMDYLIDLGPEGGKYGGKIVATGTPFEVAESKGSKTGFYLKKYFDSLKDN